MKDKKEGAKLKRIGKLVRIRGCVGKLRRYHHGDKVKSKT